VKQASEVAEGIEHTGGETGEIDEDEKDTE
jgi:hypothetical protein